MEYFSAVYNTGSCLNGYYQTLLLVIILSLAESLCKRMPFLNRIKCFYDIKIFHIFLQGGHTLTPLPGATPCKPGSAVSIKVNAIVWSELYFYLNIHLKCIR